MQVQTQMAAVSGEGKRHMYAVGQSPEAVAQRFQRRQPSACQELLYMFDGDDNGVCRFIGTSYGQQEWVSPVLSGQIKVCSVLCSAFMHGLHGQVFRSRPAVTNLQYAIYMNLQHSGLSLA